MSHNTPRRPFSSTRTATMKLCKIHRVFYLPKYGHICRPEDAPVASKRMMVR